MKKIIIAILLTIEVCYAQEKIPFVDYTEIQKLAEKSELEGDFIKAAEHLNKVNKNDSVYYYALSDKAYYLLNAEKYDEVIKIADEVIKNGSKSSRSNSYINKGVALTNLKKFDKAIENYNDALKVYPKNYLLWYNKGVTSKNQENYDEAVACFKTSMTLNPFYKNTHIQLGDIFYKQKRITQALMSYNFYLLLDPDAAESSRVLEKLNQLVKTKNPNERDEELELSDADDSYEEIDLILESQMSLKKEYEIDNKINISLTRQNHIMLELLKKFEGDGGFWEQKYGEFYKWIAENELFDVFTYTISYSVRNEKLKKVIKRKEKDIINFFGQSREKWSSIMSKNEIDIKGETKEVSYVYNENNRVAAIGEIEEELKKGLWRFYDNNGLLVAEGEFDDKGGKKGSWTWYFDFGKVKETASYKDGELEGENLMYHENGKLYIQARYSKGTLNGEYKYYNDKGALIQKKYFKENKLDGVYNAYFSVGEELPEFYVPYKDGVKDGEFLEYYANGDVYYKANYSGDNVVGTAKKFHFNKKLSSEIEYSGESMNGSYRSYHDNGQLQEDGQTLEGQYHGPWKIYYDNGVLQNEFTYDKGRVHGLYKYYDTDGKLYYEYQYRKGEIISYKFYNKKGEIVKEDKKRGGEFYYENYSPRGVKTIEGLYDISGIKKGEWKYYTRNGVLESKCTYVDNKVEGDYIGYHNNGEISYVTPYKNDSKEGYYVAYHVNKKISVQGWYKENLEHGEWRYYYLDGSLQNIGFYHKGKLHGTQNSYGVNGKLEYTSVYNYGDLLSETYFDKDGKEFQKVEYNSDKNSVSINHFNGKERIKMSYANQVKHGDYVSYYFKGNKKVTGSYRNGEQNGTWTWFYENGDIESQTTYLNGRLNGENKSYYKNGNVEVKASYKNGSKEGKHFEYYKDGTIEGIIEYKNDKIHGRREFYDKSGKLQLIRFYDKGELLGYSYLNKNGDEVDMISLPKESGEIKAFFDNGKPSVIMTFKNGDIVGDYKSFYYSGEVHEEIFFDSGNYNGEHKKFYVNGKLEELTNYNLGTNHGVKIYFYENGNKKKEENYSNGYLNGEVNEYNKDGKLIVTKKYVNDNMYSVEKF
ncbi:tetratricopeptide repeat protein [Tenacibaculum sp. 190524A05c]|uniref:TPR_REGION domain-containing protein n=1 Tax=Tenacibaculum platacis TaxID=3137852 RepID=A0ABP1ET17_9FLAO